MANKQFKPIVFSIFVHWGLNPEVTWIS